MAKTKGVTDPFDDKVKARLLFTSTHPLVVYASSGSQHSADQNLDHSPSLSNLLCYGYLDHDDTGVKSNDDSDFELDHHRYESTNEIEQQERLDLITHVLDQKTDEIRNLLVLQVSKALHIFSFVKSNKSLLRRNVMTYLRTSCGYNAAVCKTNWESSAGVTAGTYEFIDVLIRSESESSRYFIDLDFAAEFEIAKQTNQYERLVQNLPRVFIGRSESLKKVVKVMSEAARRSMKSRGLHTPPWRKNRFMQNKWLAPYRRTVNFISAAIQTSTVKCRSVGFDASFCGATTRTR